MARPQIVVNVTAALQRRGAPTDTGVAFMVYAGSTGSTKPVECFSKSDATTSGAPDLIATYVGIALSQGAPKVVLLRAEAAAPAAVTQPEWKTALAKLVADYGPGQVFIPGVSAPAAHAALLEHAATTGRCVLLDTGKNDIATQVAAMAASIKAAEGSQRAALLAGWSKLPGSGGVEVEAPGSVVAAGLVARGDAAVGHANHAPAGDQGRGAGFVAGALGLVTSYTDAEHDTLHDAGVAVFRSMRGVVQLYGWPSVSGSPDFRQLGWGRMAMQLESGVRAAAEKFLFRQIDGQGKLFAELEGLLRGYLQPFFNSNPQALFGADADEAYDVEVASVNTPATIAAGELRAAVEVRLSTHAERVRIDITTRTEGAAA